MVMVHAGEFC